MHARYRQFEFALDEGLFVLTGVVPGFKAPTALIGASEKVGCFSVFLSSLLLFSICALDVSWDIAFPARSHAHALSQTHTKHQHVGQRDGQA